MKKLLDVVLPHKRNNYKPHAIRVHGLVLFAVYILVFQTIYNTQQSGQFAVLGYATNVSSSGLLSETNARRSSSGLSPYASSVRLAQAAQSKANHMIANDYWSHYSPDGVTPWYFIGQSGYSYTRAGENLAYGFSTSAGVVQGWMDSPTHKANILDKGFVHVGFGIANGSNFQGGENTVVVAMYGEPIVTAPAPAPSTTTASTKPKPSTTTPASTAPLAQADEPVEEPKKEEPKQEPEEEPEETVADTEEDESSGHRLLAELAEGGGIVVTGEAASIEVGDTRITNIQALFNGSAHWSLYMVVGGMMAMALIYFIRHMQAIGQVFIHGEHYVVGHPTLEASIVYLAIWLMMFATYGVVI